MSNAPSIRCPYCGQRHKPRFLCDTAAGLLQAMLAKARTKGIGVGQLDAEHDTGGDTVLQSITVIGAAVDIAGGTYPGVIFTGTDLSGRQMPRWTYAADPENLLKVPGMIMAKARHAVELAGGPTPE